MTKTIRIDGTPAEITTELIQQTKEYSSSVYCPSCGAFFKRKAETATLAEKQVENVLRRHIAEVCILS